MKTSDFTRLVKRHAPKHFMDSRYLSEAKDIIESGQGIEAIVLVADIRASSLLLQQAIDPRLALHHYVSFVRAAKEMLHSSWGWYDKFLGDGFLSYWLLHPNEMLEILSGMLSFCQTSLTVFRNEVWPDILANSTNLPSDVGLSFGIDAGLIQFATLGDELTIVGQPVVGATRMVTAARKWEICVNVYPGRVLSRIISQSDTNRVSIQQESRPTKEHPNGQELFVLKYE